MKNLFLILTSLLIAFVAYPQQVITPETALSNYLDNEDYTKAWEIRDSYFVGDVRAFSLFFISQKWQDILWKHELIVFAPDTINFDGSLIFISGGSVKNGMPNFSKQNDETSRFIAALADKNKAIVALLRQVPNQPLYHGLYEDALISYTLNEFKKDNDYSWPLLFPMVKSVQKAIDAVQEFSNEKLNQEINRFVLSGASKRGWTTWLTAASQDQRVVAIAPMVIDMLNMPVTLEYQKEMYNEYSEQIEDYVKLEIPQAINSEFGNALVKMIDPYSYKDKLTVPKMIFLGTNDEYWTVDAIKHYINDIPGNNLLHYVANAGHKLGDKKQAFNALSAFLALNLNKSPLPENSWQLIEKGNNINLEIEADVNQLLKSVLWTSYSNSRDFRKADWSSEEIKLNNKNNSKIETKIKYPKMGYKAFYVDFFYPDPNGGEFSVSTRIYVTDKKNVFVK